MSEAQKAKILRVGVVQGGKIIEEKLIRRRTAITVGSSTKNTVVLTAAGVPKSLALFEIKGGEYFLCFTNQTPGRVSVGDQPASDLQSLKAQQLVRQVGETYQLRLTEAHRGRIELGEVIILFQFVTPPPEPVRPQLPASVKGYWTRNIDWPYTSTLGALFACLAVLSIWSRYVPLPTEDLALEDIPDRFAKMIMPDKEMEIPSDDGAGKKEDAEPDKGDKEEPKDTPDEGDSEEARAAAAARKKADMDKKVSGRGLLKILGAKGPGGLGASGAVADVFSEGSGDGSGDGAFEGIGGLDVATSAGEKGIRGGEGGGEAAKIEDMGTRGVVGGAGEGTRAHTGAKVVAKVSSAALQEFDSGGSRTQEDIKKVVGRRLGGIKSCYEDRLKRNPELKGKVVVRFVIHPGGKVLEAEVVENTTNDPDLAACIVAKIRAIRFPEAEGGDTLVTYPFVLAPV